MKLIGSKYKKGSFLLAESLLHLNGVNQYVFYTSIDRSNLGVNFQGSQDHSYEFLISFPDVITTKYFAVTTENNVGDFFRMFISNGNIGVEIMNGTTVVGTLTGSNFTVKNNTLVHVVINFNSTAQSIYINSKLAGTSSINITANTLGSTNSLLVGQYISNYYEFDLGLIRMYSKVLTENEILIQSKEPLYVQKLLTSDAVSLLNVNKFANKKTDILISWSTLNN